MRGYKISDLDSNAKKLIQDNNLDKNKDGLINEDNGELAELLSKADKSSIRELAKRDNRLQNLLLFEAGAGAATGMYWFVDEEITRIREGEAHSKEVKASLATRENNEKRIQAMVDKIAKKHNIKEKGMLNLIRKEVIFADSKNCDFEPEFKYGGCVIHHVPRKNPDVAKNVANVNDTNNLKKMYEEGTKDIRKVNWTKQLSKAANSMKGIRGAGATLKGALALFTLLFNPITMIPACIATALIAQPGKRHNIEITGHDDLEPMPEVKTELPVKAETLDEAGILKGKFEDGFKELGVSDDTELTEYIPQKGEYWISILKAKYGVDDITAQKMANKIKEMIYDDPKAAKQSPIMYLPEVWNFEGKTYNYNAEVEVATTETYSEDVKTEMGKMSKELEY